MNNFLSVVVQTPAKAGAIPAEVVGIVGIHLPQQIGKFIPYD